MVTVISHVHGSCFALFNSVLPPPNDTLLLFRLLCRHHLDFSFGVAYFQAQAREPRKNKKEPLRCPSGQGIQGRMGLVVFDVDTQSPHPGVSVEGNVVQRQTNGGWVTVRSQSPLSRDNHQWAVMVLDQGEGNDGSGLMIGVLPALADTVVSTMGSKYISELGGWCLSRAGDCYGTWKCEKVVFTTGSVVEFDWDAVTRTLYIICGKTSVVAHIPSVAPSDELYPAISMYYLNQKLAFV